MWSFMFLWLFFSCILVLQQFSDTIKLMSWPINFEDISSVVCVKCLFPQVFHALELLHLNCSICKDFLGYELALLQMMSFLFWQWAICRAVFINFLVVAVAAWCTSICFLFFFNSVAHSLPIFTLSCACPNCWLSLLEKKFTTKNCK